jgi:hypothetical protein
MVFFFIPPSSSSMLLSLSLLLLLEDSEELLLESARSAASLSILLITSASSSRFSSAAAGMPAASSVARAMQSLLVEAGRTGVHTPCTHCLLDLHGKEKETGLNSCLHYRGPHDDRSRSQVASGTPIQLTQQQREKVPLGCSLETAWLWREACQQATNVFEHGHRAAARSC